MEFDFKRRLTSRGLPAIALGILLVLSLYLLSSATQDPQRFAEIYPTLLVITGAEIVLLILLIFNNISRLVRQYRNGATGSRLTVRLIAVFTLLSVAPVSVVYYFSLDFLQRGIDSWFDVSVGDTLEGALQLSRVSLEERMREQLKVTDKISTEVASMSDSQLTFALDDVRREFAIKELTLLSASGHIIASSSDTPTQIIPNMPHEDILLQVRQGHSYAGVEPFADQSLYVRVLVNVPQTDSLSDVRILQSLVPVTERMNSLAGKVQFGYEQYREMGFMREPLKFSFVLTLSLVLLLSVFAAVWAAFYSARRLVAPIRVLAIGTRLVSSGEYGKKLPQTSNDEFGILVHSFNEMTKKIAQSRDEAEQSQQRAERQKAYLEAVLGRLSSGVLVLDKKQIIRTANKAASQVFGFELTNEVIGKPIHAISQDNQLFGHFVEAILPHLQEDFSEWREEVIFFGATGRQVLMCRGASLLGEGDLAGYVIVFDDITALIQVQHDAAWGEVARRLAHEIKNPLTPIQLSAERLRHKYLSSMESSDAEVLDRATNTIVQQVETMKEMVKAFSDYARSPKLKLQSLDLNGLIGEVLDLYHEEGGRIAFRLNLQQAMPLINADVGRMRQLLNNLIKNAIEAIPKDENGEVCIETRQVDTHEAQMLELTVKDNGPGFPKELEGKVFEPYVTSKPKGSGLGMAIVKKIVEEHSGVISAENCQDGGASVVVRLPIAYQSDAN